MCDALGLSAEDVFSCVFEAVGARGFLAGCATFVDVPELWDPAPQSLFYMVFDYRNVDCIEYVAWLGIQERADVYDCRTFSPQVRFLSLMILWSVPLDLRASFSGDWRHLFTDDWARPIMRLSEWDAETQDCIFAYGPTSMQALITLCPGARSFPLPPVSVDAITHFQTWRIFFALFPSAPVLPSYAGGGSRERLVEQSFGLHEDDDDDDETSKVDLVFSPFPGI